MAQSLRDSLLASLVANLPDSLFAHSSAESTDSTPTTTSIPTQRTPTASEVLSQRISVIAQTTRPTSQTKTQKAKFDQLMRRSHYADQTDHLKRQGITTNSSGSPLDEEATEQMMRRREVPTKRAGKKTKMTRDTSLSFNRAALQGVPGGSRNGTNLPAMMWAEETGTMVVDDLESNTEAQQLLARLSRSSKNCDTTRQNYII